MPRAPCQGLAQVREAARGVPGLPPSATAPLTDSSQLGAADPPKALRHLRATSLPRQPLTQSVAAVSVIPTGPRPVQTCCTISSRSAERVCRILLPRAAEAPVVPSGCWPRGQGLKSLLGLQLKATNGRKALRLGL